MEEKETLTVTNSEHSIIPEGTTLTVHRDQTNQFSDRRTLTVSADTEIPNRTADSRFQVYRTDSSDAWTEIHVGLSREHEKVRLE